MRTRLEWFVVPCVASMFAGNAISLSAQDAPKPKRTINVVLKESADDSDFKSIRDRVAKELESSGIGEDAKAKILMQIEAAMNAAEKQEGKKAKTATKQAEGAISKAKAAAEHAEGAIANAKEHAEHAIEHAKEHAEHAIEHAKLLSNRFTTQLFRDPKGESFRIGVQCVQMNDENSGEVTDNGLEVTAVFDDSPAAKAGIEEGDRLLSVDATKISKIADLTNALQAAGKKEVDVAIEVKRDDKTLTLKVKPTKMKSADLELENIQLALPTEGYVLDEDAMKSFQEQLLKWNPAARIGRRVQILSPDEKAEELKNDLDELKKEMAELKTILREIAKSVGDKK